MKFGSFYLQKEVCEAVEVVLPRRHFLIVRFEQAKVKKFQLHNMGDEAERKVGVVSLISSFLSQPRKLILGLYLKFVQFDHGTVGENLP
jgi:hypothetical protein